MRVIGRRLRWRVCLLGLVAVASAASAQRPRLAASEVAQIANEALRVITPPSVALSGIPVATRGIAFDMRGTLAAFGATAATDTVLSLDRAVANVTHAVLRDCSQMEPKPCAALGSRVYVSINPLSLTSSRAHVRVNVHWADRGTALGAGRPPNANGFLTGYSATIHLSRKAGGAWVFEKQDRSVLVM